MNSQTENYKQQIERMAQGQITLDPKQTLLLVVDMVNDGCRDKGSFKKIPHADISMFQAIEPNIINLMRACKKAKIPRICVQSIYDFAYISPAMRQRFEAMGIKDGQIAPKGAWGSQIIGTLMKVKPDYIMVKSHYSVFAKGRSMLWGLGNHRGLESYLRQPAIYDKDKHLKPLSAFYEYAEQGKEANSMTLDGFIAKQFRYFPYPSDKELPLDTMIIVGGSTHVCEDAAVSGASERGYRVIEPIDAVASEDYKKHYAYLHNHGIFKSQLTTTAKLIEAMGKAK
jgi:nicotinamidase-related amidase